MSQAQAVQETFDWLSGIGDPTFVTASYREVVRTLARTTGVFRQWAVLQAHAGQAVYEVGVEGTQIETVVWAQTELLKTESMSLDLTRPVRHLDTGTPIMWFEDTQRQNRFEVYPTPAGTDTLVVFYRDVPEEAEVPSWLDGLLAMQMAAREARRLGETQDQPLADALEQVAAGLTAMLLAGSLD